MSEYDYDEYQDNEGKSSWGAGIGLGICIGVGVFIGSVLGGSGKYEGMTAEEWYYEYDYENGRYEDLYACVEDLSYSDDYEDLSQIYSSCL